MDKQAARVIADEWAEVAGRDPKDPYRLSEAHAGHDRARTAVMRKMVATIPDGAVVAAVDDDRKKPRVVAVEPGGRALYRVDFVPFGEDVDRHFVRDGDVQATAMIIGLDPTRSRVETSTHWAQGDGLVRVTRWRFALGDDELVFTTDASAGGPLPQSEAFAHALCAAIGCPLPESGTGLERAA
jgi:hypothetical protein